MSPIDPVVDDPEVLARVASYEALIAALVARRHEIGLSQLLTDEIGGLQTGYTAKIECLKKGLGRLSFDCLLGALGLEIIVVRRTPHHLRHRSLPRAA